MSIKSSTDYHDLSWSLLCGETHPDLNGQLSVKVGDTSACFIPCKASRIRLRFSESYPAGYLQSRLF